MGGRGSGRLFEAGRLLTFSTFRMGAYSRWALIRGWALIRINTVIEKSFPPGCLNLAQFKYITFYAEDAFIQKNVYSQKS